MPTSEVNDSNIPELDIDPFSREALSDPYALHPLLRDTAAVVRISKYGIYAMARHAQVMPALRDWQTFTSERGVGLADFAKEQPWRPRSLLLESDPPAHDRVRSIANKVVSLASLREVRPQWERAAHALLDDILAKGRVDAVTDLAERFPQLVFADTIGLREDGRELLVPYATANFNAFGPRNDVFHSTEPQRLAGAPWIEESCTRAFIRPGGWGEALFAAADRGECTEAEASRLVRSLITAGFDTTINALANTFDVLADEPEAWAQLRAEPRLAKRAFEEVLRLRSPVQNFFRTTTRDVAVEDYTIPAGSKVLLGLGAANRDPRHWENPEAFDLHRNTSGHVAFGFGVHQCLGQMVARQEGELLLTAMVDRITRFERAGPTIRRLNNSLSALSSVPVMAQ